MNVQTLPAEEWVLIAKGDDGKDHEAGRFVTDALAIQFAQDYGVTDWRLVRKATAQQMTT